MTRPPPLPSSGLASDVLAQLQPPDPNDPDRLGKFVESVAQRTDAPAAKPEQLLHVVTFRLGNELHAAPVERVREIIRVHALTRVPQAPEHIRGGQSLRGAILPVLETKTRLGLPPVELCPDSRIIVVEARQRLLGLLVDAVLQVHRVPASQVQPPPPEVRSRGSQYVVGVVPLGERLALLLDLDGLLALPAAS